MNEVPPIRITVQNQRAVRPGGDFVLYWMTSARRARFNFALDRAAHWARELDRPLVVLEALRVDYPHASDRFHSFVADGMRSNQAAFEGTNAAYVPYIEPSVGAGKGLVSALAARACVVVTDQFPTFFLPRMLAAVAPRLPVRLESIDGNGLLPLRVATQPFAYAHQFRRFLQKTIAPHLRAFPSERPLARLTLPGLEGLPREITRRWPPTDLDGADALIARLPIDHAVTVVEERGGHGAAKRTLTTFLNERLARYGTRSHPDDEAASGLSFHLHFGHISTHEIFDALARRTGWTVDKLGAKAHGKREGFWNLSEPADAFLDELVTWRELGLVRCHTTDDYMRWDGLPAWARATLEAHAADPREHVYDRSAFEAGRTHDPVWNATMRQLREEGRIQSYLRMLWGKKILEWTRHPRDALEIMIALNDRWSVDGRDPSSYTNIGWVLGAYDRAWVERPVFGKVRYMTSDSAMRKLRMKRWMQRWAEGDQGRLDVGE